MLLGTAEYNKAASSALNEAEREKLKELALGQSIDKGEAMSIREIKRTAAKVSNLVCLHLLYDIENTQYARELLKYDKCPL